MSKKEIKVFSIIIATFAGVLANLYLANVIDVAQAIGLIITFALVLVTIIYAKRTAEIARETREQRYSECLPLLVPDVIRRSVVRKLEPNEIDYQTLQTGVGIEVIWHNLGKGVAINSRFSFYPPPASSGKAESFPPHELGTLGVDDKKEVDFDKIFERYNRETKLLDDKRWHQISNTYQPRLEAEYQDIYERKITTVQEFRIEDEEQNRRKIAFLGDLYFTVNGRRLGEEVVHHDS